MSLCYSRGVKSGPPLKFGTSGWRAVIADEFTFDNSRRAVSAIARDLATTEAFGSVLIGYDTRFLARRFAEEAARLFSQHGFGPLVSDRPVPTPVLAFEIRRRKAVAGINFTASHNPPQYLGLKLSTADGAPALPAVTSRIEARIAEMGDVAEPIPGAIETFDPRPEYLADLREKVGGSLRNVPVALDFRYGTSAGFLDGFFEAAGAPFLRLHANADPLFGGQSPQCSEKELVELSGLVTERSLQLGLATDGDADRFGVLDEGGHYIQPNAILALVALDLMKRSVPRLGIARSVATTHALDAVAAKFGVPLLETPVGFKFIGELLLEGKITFGGEESAGLTMAGHVPEKDGILADALVARAVAESGLPLSRLLADFESEIGAFHSTRVDVPLDAPARTRLAALRKTPPTRFAGRTVEKTNLLDGLKLLMPDGAWVLFRESGTEPLARFYAEAHDEKTLAELVNARGELFKE
jgi:phosphoglucomutase